MPISKDSVILSCLSLIVKRICLGCIREIHKKFNISYLTHFFVTKILKTGVNWFNAYYLRVASNYLAVLPGSHNNYKNT